jgi:hypothetical protein
MSNTVYSLLAQHREEAQLGEAVEQLKVLPAFHKVFDVHLFTDEVSSLVYQLAELDKTSAEYSAVIDKLNAISYLKKYLHDLAVKGSEANQHIIEAQSYLHEEDEE